MGEIVIKLDDEKLVERLTDMAKAHNRSVESEVADILGNAAGMKADFDPLKEAKRIAAMTPRGQEQTDSTLLVRQDRDR